MLNLLKKNIGKVIKNGGKEHTKSIPNSKQDQHVEKYRKSIDEVWKMIENGCPKWYGKSRK